MYIYIFFGGGHCAEHQSDILAFCWQQLASAWRNEQMSNGYCSSFFPSNNEPDFPRDRQEDWAAPL